MYRCGIVCFFFPFGFLFWFMVLSIFLAICSIFLPGSCCFHGICSILDFEPFFIHSFCIIFMESAAFWRWKLTFQRLWYLHDCSTFFIFWTLSNWFLHGVYLFFWSFDWFLEIHDVQTINCRRIEVCMRDYSWLCAHVDLCIEKGIYYICRVWFRVYLGLVYGLF